MNFSTLKPRLRFSLRAIIVLMTALACFLWYHISWVKQRRAMLHTAGLHALASHDSFHRPPAPGLLGLFGAEGYQSIAITARESQWKAEQVRALFPESDIFLPLTREVLHSGKP